MKQYKIDILPIAINDITSIRTDIINRYDDQYNADKVIDGIFKKISALRMFPKRAQVRLDISKIALRFSRANKYVIAYYVDDENGIIKIYGIFHSHRDILKIIERRM